MELLKNLWAYVMIFVSNFTAAFGNIVNFIIISAIALILGAALVRAYLAGRTYRHRTSVGGHVPDEKLTDHAAESLSQAIKFQTTDGNVAAREEFFAYIRNRYPQTMAHLGCLFLPDGGIMMRWRAAQRGDLLPVMFCGHIDVVPAGEGWKHDPFGGQRENSRVYGRGALDCKNVIIGLLEAVESLTAEGFAPKRDIYFCFGHDEETGGSSGAGQIADLLTKRGLMFDMILDEGGFIKKAHLGQRQYPAAVIGVAEKGCCNYKITATSAAGYSSAPPRHTAAGVIAEAVCRIETTHGKCHILPTTRAFLHASTPAMTFGKRFAVANLPFSKPLLTRVFRNDTEILAMLRTTCAATQLTGSSAANVLPGEASAVINARLLQGTTPEGMLRRLRELLADLHVTVELQMEIEPSKITDVKNPMYTLLCHTLEETYSRLPCIASILQSATDTTYYAALSDCILRFSPFIVSAQAFNRMHGADEYITESSLGIGVELYKSFIKKL